MIDKSNLRRELRAQRRDYVAELDERIRALLFKRPPATVLDLISNGAVIGLYRETAHEAPAAAYACWFSEAGHAVALPRFADRESPMEFALFADPFGENELETGPFDIHQPNADAAMIAPDVLIVPVVGFTPRGDRLGQGGGHYDRWLADHPGTKTIGLAWDMQLCDTLPIETHDKRLDAVVTPTRAFGPFA